mgnify:CR=1 FL=1
MPDNFQNAYYRNYVKELLKKKKKIVDDVKESIIDIPRKRYAPGVFDNADTNNPKLKQVVRDMIDAQLKQFAEYHPIKKYSLIGSILTKRYRDDADLDINILFDVPESEREAALEALRKNLKDVNGKLIPGTKHPINYFVIVDPAVKEKNDSMADGVFDVQNNKFIRRPEKEQFDKEKYMDDFGKKVMELDVVKGELVRDIIDYKELRDLSNDDVDNLQSMIRNKLDEIEDSIQSIIDTGDQVIQDRQDAFQSDMSPEEIREFGKKHKLPKNVIYKMLEKYHYLKFYKKCKDILDDGNITDKEIDSLKEAVGRPKKHIAFTFGRFNPPTIGHEKLINKVASVGANDFIIVPSGSFDSKKNPLKLADKISVMKSMFPRYASKIKQIPGARTAIEVINKLNGKANEITMVVGSDRVREFETLLNRYNGVKARGTDYEFDKINVVSAGERDPDAEGATGMSASKMRDAAAKDDFKSFQRGLPTSFRDKQKLFGLVRKGMNIAANMQSHGLGTMKPISSIENFTQWQVRDLYIREQLFKQDDIVEDQRQDVSGKVVRRGTNYIVLEDNNSNLHKCWIWDCLPKVSIDEVRVHEHDLNVDFGFETISEKELEMKLQEDMRKVPQDKDVKSKDGTQPKKYYKDLKKGTKDKRANFFKKQSGYKKSDDDDDYKAAPGDKDAKTKPSKHTKKYKQMFGDSYEIGKDYANHAKDITPGETPSEPPVDSKKRAEQADEKITTNDIKEWATSSETIDKYKKRYGEEYQKEIDEAVKKMEERLKVQSFKEYAKI